MSNQAITRKGPGDVWNEPEVNDGFTDWWESISTATAREWADEFIATRGGPLRHVCVWNEVTSIESVYVDPEDVYVDDKWLARDMGGELFQRVENGKTLYRVDLEYLVSFMVAAEYAERYGRRVPSIHARAERQVTGFLAAYCVHKHLLSVTQDKDYMRTIWEREAES